MKIRYLIVFLPNVILVVLFFGLNNFVYKIKYISEGEDFDGVAVLTGGEGRIQLGVESIKEKEYGRLLISGVGEGVSLSSLSLDDNFYENRIDFGREAKTTLQNAYEISNWANKNNYKKIRIITAAYHMPRSLLLIKRVMPELKLTPFAVFTERVILDKWWLWPGTLSLLMEEYLKYILAHLQPITKG